jgi:hypothetical protein
MAEPSKTNFLERHRYQFNSDYLSKNNRKLPKRPKKSLDTHHAHLLDIRHPRHQLFHPIHHLQTAHAAAHSRHKNSSQAYMLLDQLLHHVIRHKGLMQTNAAPEAHLVAFIAANL